MWGDILINFERTLEIAGTSGFVQPIKLVQYDATLPVGVFELVENGQPFDIPAGAKAKVRMRKADGKGVYNDATVSRDTVQVVFTQQMTAAFGVGFLNIELISDGGVKSSEPVQVVVLENAVHQGAIESSDEFLTLDEIVKQVETLRQQTATDAASAAASKTAAASSATAAQSARAGAEAAESRVNSIVAGNESYTKRQSRDMFALALKATAEKAANLEIYPDEGSNVAVTSYGYTEQAGTGDPSPTNVRQITVGGRYFNETVYTGEENWGVYAGKTHTFSVSAGAFIHGGVSTLYKKISSGELGSKNGIYLSRALSVIVTDLSCSTVEAFKAKLKAIYAAGTPLTVWYNKFVDNAEEKWSPGKTSYTPIESNGAEYSCVCVPLTAPLCDGDTVDTCLKSGCDKFLVLDGSSDEPWQLEVGSTTRRFKILLSSLGDYPLAASYDHQFSDTLNYHMELYGDASFFIYKASYGGGTMMFVSDKFASTVVDLRTKLSKKPIKIWYRSTEYTEENDISVCFEKHKNAYNEYRVADMNSSENYPGWEASGVISIVGTGVVGDVNGAKCNATTVVAANTSGKDLLYVRPAKVGGLMQSQLKEQYPDLTFQFVIPYATPITYAHDPVYLEAYPDGNGVFTVSGEKLVSAKYNKSINREFEEFKAAMLAMGANLSS